MTKEKEETRGDREEAILRLLRGEDVEAVSCNTGYEQRELSNLKDEYIEKELMRLPAGAFLSCLSNELTERMRLSNRDGRDVVAQLEELQTAHDSGKDVSGVFEFGHWLHMQTLRGENCQEPLGFFLRRNFAILDRMPVERHQDLINQLVDDLRHLPVTPNGAPDAPTLDDLLPDPLIFQAGGEELRQEVEGEWSFVTEVQALEHSPNPGDIKLEKTHFVLHGNSWYHTLLWYHSSAYTRAREGVVLKINGQQVFECHWPWKVDYVKAWVTDIDDCGTHGIGMWMDQTNKKNDSDAEASYTAVLGWWMWGVRSYHSITFNNWKGHWQAHYCDGHW